MYHAKLINPNRVYVHVASFPYAICHALNCGHSIAETQYVNMTFCSTVYDPVSIAL